ncbi:MAG TPA: hypothetical protein ENF75_01595 [Acidilobales archaeon]|nr:hypothetical protein [Acidilobales archaeon]
MKEKVVKGYVIVKRILAKATIILKNKTINIKVNPKELRLTRYLKSSLSPGEFRTLLSLERPEYIINIDAIRGVVTSAIRANRCDVKDLFEEDLKEVFEVVFYLKNGEDLKILLRRNDFMRFMNYLRQYLRL